MDDNHTHRSPAGFEIPGMIRKAAALASHEVTEAELREINKHTLEPLTADQVFTFKAVLCDNEVDRQHERFTLRALQDLKKLFLGKTIIKDHFAKADNQVARIYATELATSEKILKNGEPYTQLVAKAYMVRTATNADLITEIKAGIKKEGSVGFAASGAVCSVCGTDNAKSYCPHWPGKTYQKDGHPVLCTYELTGAKDAYEFSLVAVPAQRAAGVSKSYTGTTVYEPENAADEKKTAEGETTPDNAEQAALLALRARLAEARNTANKNNFDN